MKTVIEIIFEKHDKEFDKMNFLRWLSDNRKSLLEAEKEQIIEAYTEGVWAVKYNSDESPEDFFNRTFKSDE